MKVLVKRIFDFVFSFFGLIIFLPLLVIIYIIILFIDGYPVLFVQKRVGKYGKTFKMIKFRTMKKNDQKNTVSVRGDNRITKLGSFLRKYKLDELPELLNVLLGQMSFVGPRPDVPGYADILEGEDREILNLKPGITGPATIKYTNEEEILAKVDDPQKYNDEVIFPDKVKINLEYYKNNNVLMDIKIILKTVFKI